MSMQIIDAATARAHVHSSGEIAFLDVREHGPYGEGHPLLAVWCPYSKLELLAPSLVPNPHVPVVLIDAGYGTAQKAALRLEAIGYRNVMVVEGGVRSWLREGFHLFEGEHVPSKALGELAEGLFHPETIEPETLAAWQKEGRPHLLFDVRPPAEHRKMTLPGARCLPNGELPHRFATAVPDSSVPIVLTCAGRTRSLIGSISLKLLGVANPVYGLRNGTQGWSLAGLDLIRGRQPEVLPALSNRDLEASRRQARDLARDAGIPIVGAEELGRLAADQSRTLYLFDVRTAEEFAAGHLTGAVHAPCVQIVQATDRWVGVRRARIVLADDTGLRATLAAYWLKQLGYETSVLPAADAASTSGDWRRDRAQPAPSFPSLLRIAPEEAAEATAAGHALLVDLRSSNEHRQEHPASSRWAIRPMMQSVLGEWQGCVCLIAEDDKVACLAAIDLHGMGHADVRIMDGGLFAWKAAGLPTASGWTDSTSQPIDFLAFVHDRHDGNLDAARRYLAWETGLVRRLDPEERAAFLLPE